MNKPTNQDNIYVKPLDKVVDFTFDSTVADVFEDMIQRSVPGYNAIVSTIGILAQQYYQSNSYCYDLGCSLGAATLSMRRAIKDSNCSIISVDNSPAMIEHCQNNIKADDSTIPVTLLCEDIQNTQINNASIVVLNFTLQFIPTEQRETLLKTIYDGLLPGGILVLSEKIAFDNAELQSLQTELHHTFKRHQGYSDLEIAQKRSALENVLLPDTIDIHSNRLTKIGFQNCHIWFQCFNFISMLAFRP